MTADLPVPEKQRAALASFVRAVGQKRAEAFFGLSRSALDRALSGLPCRRGTVLAIQCGIADALLATSPAALLTEDDIVRARGDARPLGEMGDAVARSMTPTTEGTPRP